MITALALLLTNRKHTCALSSPLTRTFYGTEFGHCLRHDVGASAMSPPRLALHPTPSPAYSSRFPRDMRGNNAKRSTQSQRSMPTIAVSLVSSIVCHSSIHELDPSLPSRHGKRVGLQESNGTRVSGKHLQEDQKQHQQAKTDACHVKETTDVVRDATV